MSGAAALYTPEVLGLATGLARFPLRGDLSLHGQARAPLCGSRIELALSCDEAGRITRLGLRAQACAIGQAAAALLAQAVIGQTRTEVESALAEIELWLIDPEAALPAWPGFDAIVAARAYPARHGAILLPWKAALAALP